MSRKETKNKIMFTCVVCGKDFSVWPSQVKYRNAGKYCSRACYDIARKEVHICTVCGKEYAFGRQHHRSSVAKYCSSHCQHVGQRGMYYSEKRGVYPKEFRLIRKTIISEQNNTCLLCGGIGSDVHHIDYDKTNSNPWNLVLLCKSCHTKTNYDRNLWKARFENILGCW